MTKLPEIELTPIRECLLLRISEQWGKYVSCDNGWDWILQELETNLSYIDPNYTIYQVKEKFGTLRFYAHTEKSDAAQEIFDNLIELAERWSEFTCEICGNATGKSKPGRNLYDGSVTLHINGGNYKTLCATCAEKHGYKPVVPSKD